MWVFKQKKKKKKKKKHTHTQMCEGLWLWATFTKRSNPPNLIKRLHCKNFGCWKNQNQSYVHKYYPGFLCIGVTFGQGKYDLSMVDIAGRPLTGGGGVKTPWGKCCKCRGETLFYSNSYLGNGHRKINGMFAFFF